MEYFALFYDVCDDFAARRTPYRVEHLSLAQQAHARGELLLAGALTEPVDRALLIFRCAEARTVEDFARKDPYVANGLVAHWEVRHWSVVIGNSPKDAATKEEAAGGRP